ncbi:histidine kinase-like protein [Stackebrandtia endophytica]|uniref:Histidine kinase-like protein n=1 Tax=Stackebrandtia endophytica TaxID=1496996 RepID=A0A543AWC4_9ACTN|nr:ATP-binding protein [Stackebrandtia endophytica]TQL76871.1 histidine kinase-like protein [Stackebrandtia endophytica]
MPVVRFGFSPAPVHVRTARLVASSVAQQAPLPGELLSEVRQATGEACSRAVVRHRRFGISDLVRMQLTIGAHFVAEVADFAPVTSTQLRDVSPDPADLTTQTADDDTLTEEVALTLLAGLVTDLQVIEAPDGIGSIVRMSWPL